MNLKRMFLGFVFRDVVFVGFGWGLGIFILTFFLDIFNIRVLWI